MTRRWIGVLLVLLLAGCASAEYGQAVERGDAPWYTVRIYSPDGDLLPGDMNIYRLVRRADSEEGKKEGLKADRWWGEGHGEATRANGAKVGAHLMIKPETSRAGMCGFELVVMHGEEKTDFFFVASSTKGDSCEKAQFESPFFSTRVQREDRGWMTLDFEFRRGVH
jgi:hypothetical protein